MTKKCERVYVIEGLDLSPFYFYSIYYCLFVLVLAQDILKSLIFFSTRGLQDLCSVNMVFLPLWPYSALKQNIFVCLCVYLFSHFFFIIDKHQSYSIIIVIAEIDHYKEVEPRHHPMKVTALLSSLRLPCGNVDLPCGNSKTFKKSRSRYFLENQC